jgi:hypothetical protein
MSLVICSNRENDKPADADSSIFEPWSFRNDMSSTYTIPKDSQVGLHSCKINLNGTMALSGNETMYQYFGRLIDPDAGETMALSSSQPIQTPLSEVEYRAGRASRITDYEAEGLADVLKKQMNKFIFHPNLKDKADCDVIRDNTTNEFTGFGFSYDQYADETTSTVPSADQAWTMNPRDVYNAIGGGVLPGTEREEYPAGIARPEFLRAVPTADPTLTWKYEVVGTEGVFTSTAPADNAIMMNAMINTALPLSLYNGQMVVNIKDVNDAGQDWMVGLSRFVPNESASQDGGYAPSSFDSDRGTEAHDDLFFDYAVRRLNNKLYLQHLTMNQNAAFHPTTRATDTFIKDLDYWTIAGATLTSQYDLDTNASTFEKVRFTAKGQTLKIEMIDDRDAAVVVYSFDESHTKDLQLPPIHQGCWCLHPVLAMDSDAVKSDGVMKIEVFEGCKDIDDYGWKVESDRSGSFTHMGWFEYAWYESGLKTQVNALQQRFWFDQNDTTSGKNADGQLRYASVPSSGSHRRIGYVAGTDGTGAVAAGYSEVLIPGVNKVYPSPNANVIRKLGFNQPYDESFTHVGAGATALGVVFTSDSLPTFKSGQSIFVRVSNLSQRSLNAFKGNNSQIIGHLPRFDGQAETGRLYYEPSEIMWLDLDNAQDLKVSSFDLSFVYVNEQFVKAMTGQSIVCLAFRKKPKDM